MTTGLFGGAFDPPHNGHVAVARAALDELGLERLRVLVSVAPGHKRVEAPAPARLRLAAAAFAALPRTTVEADEHARTVDALEASPQPDSLLIIGADEWRDFSRWKRPERVLELTRVAVATRPRVPVAIPAAYDGRVVAFEVEPVPVSSSDIRQRVREGLPVLGLVPPAVAALIDELGLYVPA